MNKGIEKKARRSRWRLPLIAAALICLPSCILVVALIGAAIVFPTVGAQGVDTLRQIFGDAAVAQLETTVYTFQDAVQQWEYQHGIDQPTGVSMAPIQLASVPEMTVPTATDTPLLEAPTIDPNAGTASPSPAAQSTVTPTVGIASPTPTLIPVSPTATPEPPWSLQPLISPAPKNGAGQWTPFLFDPYGKPIAYRTFLQPDPIRPYAIAAIVAFDARATRLHFVLGKVEPVSSVVITRTGRIPPNDLKAGVLLAAFNGGFKARQGNFGAMVNGVTVLPPRPGFGTVGMYSDGTVRIGEWGTEIGPLDSLTAWRQNGPLIIHNGQINPHTADFSPLDWGYTIDKAVAVWRSGLGLSEDGRTLYYVAGTSMTLPALAQAMSSAGAYAAMQLDINNTMVHFDTFQPKGATLEPQALFNTMKYQDDNRYITSDDRDFFYVTLAHPATQP